jgi:hypothetical protein
MKVLDIKNIISNMDDNQEIDIVEIIERTSGEKVKHMSIIYEGKI